jgi:hypothetical protein
MTEEKALEILTHHQKWRRGRGGDDLPMLDPKEVGLALDVAIKAMKFQAKKPKGASK